MPDKQEECRSSSPEMCLQVWLEKLPRLSLGGMRAERGALHAQVFCKSELCLFKNVSWVIALMLAK